MKEGEGGRERERQTDRQTDRQTETERHRQRDRPTDRQRQRDRDRGIDRQTEAERQRQTDRQTDRKRERKTERERQRERERDRETERDRDRETERKRQRQREKKQLPDTVYLRLSVITERRNSSTDGKPFSQAAVSNSATQVTHSLGHTLNRCLAGWAEKRDQKKVHACNSVLWGRDVPSETFKQHPSKLQ